MDLTRWERDMDRMMDEFFGRRTRPWWSQRWFGSDEVVEEKDDIVVKAEIPGMDKNSIEVNLTEHTLTIKGEKKKEEEIKKENYYRSERSYGSFVRTLPLPTDVHTDKVKATFKNGVLEVRLPRPKRRRRKKSKSMLSEGKLGKCNELVRDQEDAHV